MTLGQWIDYVIEWNNDNFAEEETVRRATQEDFEGFKHM